MPRSRNPWCRRIQTYRGCTPTVSQTNRQPQTSVLSSLNQIWSRFAEPTDLKSGGRDVTRLEKSTSGNSANNNKQTADFLFWSVGSWPIQQQVSTLWITLNCDYFICYVCTGIYKSIPNDSSINRQDFTTTNCIYFPRYYKEPFSLPKLSHGAVRKTGKHQHRRFVNQRYRSTENLGNRQSCRRRSQRRTKIWQDRREFGPKQITTCP